VLNDNVRTGSPRTELMKWWCYANDFSDQCFGFGGEAEITESDDFVACSQKVMASHDIDAAAVATCVASSYKDKGTKKESNTMLDVEIADRKEYAILTLPTAIVNGRELRGQTQYGTTMETNVARAVCQGFETVPVECDQILNPRGKTPDQPDPTKLGKVTFLATLTVKTPDASGGGTPLTAASYLANPKLQHRFTNALALKTGADPLALSLEQAMDTTGSASAGVQIGVAVTNLDCYHGKGQTSTADALKKISDCGEDLGDEGGEDEAADELKGVVFNIHSGATEVISVKVSSIHIDNTLCDSPPQDKDNTKGGNDDPGNFDPDAGQSGGGGGGGGSNSGGGGSSGESGGGSSSPGKGIVDGASPAGMYFAGMFTMIAIGGIALAVVRYRNRAPAPPLGGTMFSSSGIGGGGAVVVSGGAGDGASMAEYNQL
jgi:uncharacterized membrane protein YgcG